SHRSPHESESPAPGGSGAGLSGNPAVREWPGLSHLLLCLDHSVPPGGGVSGPPVDGCATASDRLLDCRLPVPEAMFTPMLPEAPLKAVPLSTELLVAATATW